MLRYALRRLFWTVPALLAATLVLFAVLSSVRPRGSSTAPPDSPDAMERSLPTFFNARPRDVRELSMDAMARVASGSGDDDASKTLERLGGAALPIVLPRLDSLAPEQRRRVALAMMPIAERMGFASNTAPLSSAEAVAFWTLFWQEREADFKPSVVRRAVHRLAAQGSDARRTELVELDTFALADIMDALADPRVPFDSALASRLIDIAAHAAGRDDRISSQASRLDTVACIARWQSWWLASRSDYETSSGPSRIAAMLVETRYGHWALHTLTARHGSVANRHSVFARLRSGAPLTLLIASLGLLLAHGAVAPIALIAAWQRRGWFNTTTTLTAIGAIAIPCPVIALAFGVVSRGNVLVAGAIVAIAVAMAGASLRRQRIAAADATMTEVIRCARARGLKPSVILGKHALRVVAASVAPLVALDFPLALSCACAAEKALGLRGIGRDLVRAVVDLDLPFLMSFGIASIALVALLHLLSDLAVARLDPRTYAYLLQERS